MTDTQHEREAAAERPRRRKIDRLPEVRFFVVNDQLTYVRGPYDTREGAEEAFREYDMSPSVDYYITREEREVLDG